MIKKFQDDIFKQAVNKLKDISYILEDEDLILKFEELSFYSGNLFQIRIIIDNLLAKIASDMGYNKNLSLPQRLSIIHLSDERIRKEISKSEYWKEYIDRARQILNQFGLGLGVHNLIITIYTLSPRQKRRLYKN